jgi:hypothetical protein
MALKMAARAGEITLDKKWHPGDNHSRAVPAFPLSKEPSSSHRRNSLRGEPVAEKESTATSMELDREVIRCQVCGLVQYRGQLSSVFAHASTQGVIRNTDTVSSRLTGR